MAANKDWRPRIVLAAIVGYLLLPLAATLLFSVAQEWQTTILPKGYTLEWYRLLFQNDHFIEALGRSFGVSALATIIGLIVIVPAVLVTVIYFPRLEGVLKFLSTLPFSFPPVILAVGLLELYSHKPFVLTGSIYILLGAYFVLLLPYVYQATVNSFRAIDAPTLLNAAESLGASRLQAFWHVVLPNLAPGLTVAALLSFSVLFGEFVLANLLVGSGFQTVQLFLYKMSWENGHLSSAIVSLYTLFILLVTLAIVSIQTARGKSKMNVKTVEEENPPELHRVEGHQQTLCRSGRPA
ncbi:ABC transporter permease subunit [Heliobacterium gestii]|uniref:ABC transporter permease subunit n=1 Tax=Heliomicrobium gestii TaxID=2699 RepID=A0A845LAK3_HELGE|nr:ABC transporter permease subunit [Heliomicrobium gestii]MBM7867418.1 putative spermidine/putrescine transport system permease protein [Heliomicrobium gestii]MZP43682.1 ABC transporter permease subunit [Heliomicrobium gestii]